MDDLKLIGQGNQPVNLNKLESPILGMEIHINTETGNDECNRDDEWIPSRRTRVTCMLAGTFTNLTFLKSSRVNHSKLIYQTD